jgi:hypothetical protein
MYSRCPRRTLSINQASAYILQVPNTDEPEGAVRGLGGARGPGDEDLCQPQGDFFSSSPDGP